jgi:hypothetical protein
MAKQRFVLRFGGDGAKPAGDVERIRKVAQATVLDETPQMMLVESDEEPLRRLVGSLPGWAIAPEQHLPLSDRG